MSQQTDNLLLELSAEAKKLDALHARVIRGDFADRCACVRGQPCAWHSGIGAQVLEARMQLDTAMRALVIERGR